MATIVHSDHCGDISAAADHGMGLLNERQAAQLLNIKVATLRRWRRAGKGPAFLKIGGAVRYDRAELEGFIASARRMSTSDSGAGLSGREAA
jgi:predicted DNA-binding transcriptional regulator AlpA